MIWLLGLVITAIAAAAGLMLGAPSGWMIFVALAGLLAWDLNGLNRRLSLAAPGDGAAAIRSRHLIWLGLTAVAGLLLLWRRPPVGEVDLVHDVSLMMSAAGSGHPGGTRG